MKETLRGCKLESSGRELLALDTDTISIAHDGRLVYGYDGLVELYDWQTDETDFTGGNLTAEEKEEIARHMIDKWAKWAGIAVTTPKPYDYTIG